MRPLPSMKTLQLICALLAAAVLVTEAGSRALQQLTISDTISSGTIVVSSPQPSPVLCLGPCLPPPEPLNNIQICGKPLIGLKIANIQVGVLGEYDAAKFYGQSKAWLTAELPTAGTSNTQDQRDILKQGTKAAAAIKAANWAYTSQSTLAKASRPAISETLVSVRTDALTLGIGAVFQVLDLLTETLLTVNGDLQPFLCTPRYLTPGSSSEIPCTSFRGATLARVFYPPQSTNTFTVNPNNAPVTADFGNGDCRVGNDLGNRTVTFTAINMDIKNGGFNPSKNLIFGTEAHVEATVALRVTISVYAVGASQSTRKVDLTFRAGWWTDPTCPKKDGLDTACRFWTEPLTNVEFTYGTDRYMLGVARSGVNVPIGSSLTFPLQLTLLWCSSGDLVHRGCFDPPPPTPSPKPSPNPSPVPSTGACVPGQPKPANYFWDESKNPGGANRCTNRNSCLCDGMRTCSAFGWCG